MTQANHQLAREFFDALSQGDLPDSLLTADMTAWTTSSGIWSEKARFQFGIKLLASIFKGGLIYTIQSLTSEQDRVAAEVNSKGTLINGDEYCGVYVFMLRVRDGRIASVCEYNDPVPVREKLGPLLQESLAKGR
jgi:ketosteroid isomerase-like protein